MFSGIKYHSVTAMAVLFIALAGITFAQDEYVFYGDTIIGEYPPEGRGPAPETLVVLYTEGSEVSPPQPVPDFWQSIWDINVSTSFSITKYFKKITYGASIIDAYPRAHWDGWWYYCFHVNHITPSHGSPTWYAYCVQAIIAADPEVNFADYAVPGQFVYVVVIVCCPGGGSGIFWPNAYPIATSDTFPNGATVYVKPLYAYRLDRVAMTHHFGLNVHEYNHNFIQQDYYCDYYEMGSFCGHYGYGFSLSESWVDWIPSPVNPQWRYEIKDKNTLQPWLIPTEISETQLDHPIMPMQEIYSGEAIRITMNSAEQMLQSQSFIVTNHQGLAPYEEHFPDSGLLVWHIRNASTIYGWDNHNRRLRLIDVECAHGLWQWDSTETNGNWHWWPTLQDPIYGTDSLDIFNRDFPPHGQGVYPPISSPDWRGFGSATCMWDPETYERFDAFTNPTSNLYDRWHGPLYPEYIHSHFALRNIHPDPIDETIVRADILFNYVQSDVATATSYNNSRHIVSDANGNIYMVYEAGGYVYFTSTYMDTMQWEPAYPIGKGTSPAIALDATNTPHVVWVRNDSLFWSKRQNFYTWPRELLYYSPEERYSCVTPSFVIDEGVYGHVTFEKHLLDDSWSGIYYGKLDPGAPGSISWELVNSGNQGVRCQNPSIAVDNGDTPHAVWQKNNEIYYCMRDGELEPPWQDIVNISNSTDVSYDPFIEIAANWVHVVWVEEPSISTYSKIRHRRRDLSTGRWYTPQWVNNSQVFSISPQTICGDQIVWAEEVSQGNFEIYHSTWDYELSSWGTPENISVTAMNSTAPQIVEVEDEENPIEERYLITIWCENDGVLYEVRKDKKSLLEHKVKYYIDFGQEIHSPYTLARDGYISYGSEDYKNVDYGLNNITYRITGFKSENTYPFKCMFYHENNNNLTLRVKIDNVIFNTMPIPSNQLITCQGTIPDILIQDGEITVNNIVVQGGPGVLSSVVIYEMHKPPTGGPQSILDIEKSSDVFIINPSVTSEYAHITYQLACSDWVTISVFDVTGRKVKTLVEGNQPAGSYELWWDKTDEKARRLGSGIYFICLENQNRKATQKLIIVN